MQIVRIGLLAMSLAVPTPLLAQDKAADFAKEYQALVEKFEADSEAFYKPVSDAKSDEAQQKAIESLDQSKNPAKLYLEKFNDLADRADGTDTGARALLFVATRLGADPDASRRSLNILLDDYMKSPLMAEVADAVANRGATPQQTEAMLKRILDECPVKDAQANALGGLAKLKQESNDPDAAKALFARLKADFPDSNAAKEAAAALFVVEHLQPGMTVPDITGTDQDGREFKLSDYKGKVVVLDFWGFW